MSQWDYGLEPYDDRIAQRRKHSIPGTVETVDEKAERERREAAKRRKELTEKMRLTLRDLDAARDDFRLAKWWLAASAVPVIPIAIGWFMTSLMVFAPGNNHGGQIAFSIVFLIILTGTDIAFLCGLGDHVDRQRKMVRKTRHAHDDALNALNQYELEHESSR